MYAYDWCSFSPDCSDDIVGIESHIDQSCRLNTLLCIYTKKWARQVCVL